MVAIVAGNGASGDGTTVTVTVVVPAQPAAVEPVSAPVNTAPVTTPVTTPVVHKPVHHPHTPSRPLSFTGLDALVPTVALALVALGIAVRRSMSRTPMEDQ